MVGVGCGGDHDKAKIGQAENVDPNEKATYEYNVPFGTGNRMDSGEVVEIMPSDLQVTVGESIRIDNDDIRDYMIGPFFVMAGRNYHDALHSAGHHRRCLRDQPRRQVRHHGSPG